MGWRLFEVVLCLAGMAAVFAVFRWLIYGINDGFGIGVGVGVLIGLGIAFYARYADKRDGWIIELTADQRRERRR